MSSERKPNGDVIRPAWRVPEVGVVSVLAARWRAEPRRHALHIVELHGSRLCETPVSLDALFATAGRAAAELESAGAGPGDRVLLSLGDPRAFAAWFLGAIGRGIAVVPLPPMGSIGAASREQRRVAAVSVDCAPRLAIVDQIANWRAALGDSSVLPAIEARVADTSGPSRPVQDASPSTMALIQYTSGSTGAPKGVVITHGNLAANLQAISSAMGVANDERMISWLPLHHDMGLVGGLLWPLFAGGEAFMMMPLAFLSRPIAWLQAVADFGGTVTVAPNFAYSICARKIPERHLGSLDLSTLRLALCGAEPVDAEVIRAFASRFAPYGLGPHTMFPVYGLAEATLAVAFPRPNANVAFDVVDRHRLATTGCAAPVPASSRNAQTLVSVGFAVPGQAIEIRDPLTHRLCSEREVGEVIVCGPSLSPGYWAEPARPPRVELSTGDVGYFADERLYIVDRLKDLVIVGGQNYASSDIEYAVANVAGVRTGRVIAFGSRRAERGTEVAVVVAELDLRSRLSPTAIRAQMGTAVRERVAIEPEIVLVAPGAIEKTTSGKLRRRACALQYEAGKLPVVEGVADVRRLRRRRLLERLFGRRLAG